MAAPSVYGLPTQGYVPVDVLAAQFPYLTFGPTQALQLANLQFGAQADAAMQNQRDRMQLAQMASSTRLADNVASRLALRGFGNTPAFGSALSRPWQDIQVPNIFNMFGEATRPLSPLDALRAQQAGRADVGDYISRVNAGLAPAPSVPGAFRYGNQGGPSSWMPRMAQGGVIPFGGSAIVGEQGPEMATNTGFGGTQISPFGFAPGGSPMDRRQNRFGKVRPTGSGGFGGTGQLPPYGNDFPTFPGGGGTIPRPPGTPQQRTTYQLDAQQALRSGNKPLADYYLRVQAGLEPYDAQRVDTLRGLPAGAFGAGAAAPGPLDDIVRMGFGTGRPGAGPAYFNDQALGLSNIPAPRLNISDYRTADPFAQEAQNYLLSLFGYTPEMLAYERHAFTPGARFTARRPFGFN